jgi:hypothetical protein
MARGSLEISRGRTPRQRHLHFTIRSVRNNFKMSQINKKINLVIITTATALMYYTIFANNNGNKKGNDVYGKNNVTVGTVHGVWPTVKIKLLD